MKFFFLFAPKFHELPLAVARKLQGHFQDCHFLGLVTGSRAVWERVSTSTAPVVAPIHYLDELERDWLSKPTNDKRISEIEARLGVDVFRRIIIADRQVGVAFVRDVKVLKTGLILHMASTDIVKRYVLGLLDYVFHTLEKERPDLVFCYTVAGALGFALGIVSQYLRIPFARISSTHVMSRYCIDTSIALTLEPVHQKFLAALKNPSILADSLPAAEEYLRNFRARPIKYAHSAEKHCEFVRSHSLVNIGRQVIMDCRMVGSAAIKRRHHELRQSKPIAIRLAAVSNELSRTSCRKKQTVSYPGGLE